jgi:fructosamine-3-kinase
MPIAHRPLARVVAAAVGSEVAEMVAVHGGDVARSYRVTALDGTVVFAKTHERAPAGFFTTEADGLRWLRAAQAVAVPEVVAVGDGDEAAGVPNHLVLAWVDEGPPRGDTEAELGRQLAALHASGAPCFGRTDRRTTGSRGLPNEPCATWAEFAASQRLLPLARLAHDEGALAPSVIADLEALAGRLDEVGGPAEPPARLHGDLWAGNRLVDRSGGSWLIDPAAHGGHREFDLAMMALFGGYGADAFAAYQEVAPLADGWRQRVALHQIAPLVVHAIKFGGGYRSAAAEAIARYR